PDWESYPLLFRGNVLSDYKQRAAESFAAWKRHPTTGAIRYGTRELFDLQSDLAKMGLPTSGNVRKLKERKRRYRDWDAESFNAPYAGAGALMPIKGDTALSSFSGKELAQSSAIHGDFNQASINYSGHQNLEVRGAEENRFPYPEAQVTNIVRVKDKVYVTIRYPDTDEYYGYEKILVGDMEDVMLAESFGAEYGKRQRFGNRYVARNTKGEFISNVGVGASLKADRRNKSKTPARSGFGNRGDSQKGAIVDSSGKSLVGLGLLVGGVWALLDSRGTQSIK
nr:hypothetical protein [Candidatus Poseidoniales archaeon]